MTSNKKPVLGVDIGGSKINMVLWNGKKVIKTWRAQPATLAILRKGLEIFDRALGPVNFKIGIAVPGLADEKTGAMLRCPNLPAFNGLNLKKELKKDVRIGNDAKCFLLAETKLGFAKNRNRVLGIVFGTGVGGDFSGCKGKGKWQGEFGHMVIDKGKTWEKLYQQTKNKPKEQEKINAIGLANLINIFNPEIIVLAGRGAMLPNKELIARHLLIKEQMPEIIYGKLGEDAVAIGASLLFQRIA